MGCITKENFGVAKSKGHNLVAISKKFIKNVIHGNEEYVSKKVTEDVNFVHPHGKYTSKTQLLPFVKLLGSIFKFNVKIKGCSLRDHHSVMCEYQLWGRFVKDYSDSLSAHKKVVEIDGAVTLVFEQGLVDKALVLFDGMDLMAQLKGNVRKRDRLVKGLSDIWNGKLKASEFEKNYEKVVVERPSSPKYTAKTYMELVESFRKTTKDLRALYECEPTTNDYNHWLCNTALKFETTTENNPLKLKFAEKAVLRGVSSIYFDDRDEILRVVEYYNSVDGRK